MKVLIAGSGKMGTDIFNYLLPYGFEMVWLCLNDAEAAKMSIAFHKRANRQLKAGIIDQTGYDQLISRITITADYGAAKETDMYIEAIWEDASAKWELFDKLDQLAKPEALFISNTSSIPLSELFIIPDRKAFCCGLHFFFPLMLKNIVEVNVTNHTSTATVNRLLTFLSEIERNYLILPEPEHFLLNRLLLKAQAKAMNLHINEQIAAKDIDAIIRNKIFPIGIFEFFDHVGLDIMFASVTNYSVYQDKRIDCTELLNAFKVKLASNCLGVKSGEGFYKYPLNIDLNECSLSLETQHRIQLMIEDCIYSSLATIIAKEIINPEELDRALDEYWSENLGLIGKSKTKGFLD